MINGEPGSALKARSGERGQIKVEHRSGGRRLGGGMEGAQDTVTNHCQRPRPGVTAGERHLEGTAALYQAELQPSSLTGSLHEDTLAPLVHMHTRLRTPSLAAWWGDAEIFFFPSSYFGAGEAGGFIRDGIRNMQHFLEVTLLFQWAMTTLRMLRRPSERRSSTQSEIPPIVPSFWCLLTFTIGKGIQLAIFLLRGHSGDQRRAVSLRSACVLVLLW